MDTDRTKEINGKSKWTVNAMLDEDSNRIPEDNGYYGRYTLITYKGKQAVVYVDDRDAKVNVMTGWYDMIFYGAEFNTWSGDYRWNNDKPLVVMDNNLYNAVAVHSAKLILDKWMTEMDPKFQFRNASRGVCVNAVDDTGNPVIVMDSGNVISVDTSANNDRLLEKVNGYSTDEIISEWIGNDMPCAHIRGMEYKGARPGKVTKENAMEYILTHNRFGGMFNSAEWSVIDGRLTLLFRDYADSDYD